MRRIVASLFVPLAAVVALIAAPSVANATDYGVNMSQACQISYGAGWQAELTYPSQGATDGAVGFRHGVLCARALTFRRTVRTSVSGLQ